MNITYKSGNFSEYSEKVDEMYSWFESLGIRVSPTRIREYQKSFDLLLNVVKTRDEVLTQNLYPEFAGTLYEVHELLNIYECFRNSVITERIRKSLQAVCTGPRFYEEENTSSTNRARSTAFELLVAARLIKGGIDAELSFPTDIICKVGKSNIFLECKRPQSESKILRNIKSADSQLQRRYKKSISKQTRGVIAIDLTRCLLPERQLLEFESSQDLEKIMGEVVENFFNEYCFKTDEYKHRKTIGLVMRVSLIATPKDTDDRLHYCQQHGYFSFESSSREDRALSKKIGEAFQYHVAA